MPRNIDMKKNSAHQSCGGGRYWAASGYAMNPKLRPTKRVGTIVFSRHWSVELALGCFQHVIERLMQTAEVF